MRLNNRIRDALQHIYSFLDANSNADEESELFSRKTEEEKAALRDAIEWIADVAFKERKDGS